MGDPSVAETIVLTGMTVGVIVYGWVTVRRIWRDRPVVVRDSDGVWRARRDLSRRRRQWKDLPNRGATARRR